jgi:hypothetical protein
MGANSISSRVSPRRQFLPVFTTLPCFLPCRFGSVYIPAHLATFQQLMCRWKVLLKEHYIILFAKTRDARLHCTAQHPSNRRWHSAKTRERSQHITIFPPIQGCSKHRAPLQGGHATLSQKPCCLLSMSHKDHRRRHPSQPTPVSKQWRGILGLWSVQNKGSLHSVKVDMLIMQ